MQFSSLKHFNKFLMMGTFVIASHSLASPLQKTGSSSTTTSSTTAATSSSSAASFTSAAAASSSSSASARPSTCRSQLEPNLLSLLIQINAIYNHQLITTEDLQHMSGPFPPWWHLTHGDLQKSLHRTPKDFSDLKELEKFLEDLSYKLFPSSTLRSHWSSQEIFLREEAKRTILRKGLLQLIEQLDLAPSKKATYGERIKASLGPLLKNFWPRLLSTTEPNLDMKQAELILLFGTDALKIEERPLRKFYAEKFSTYAATLSFMSLLSLGVSVYEDIKTSPLSSSIAMASSAGDSSLLLNEVHSNLLRETHLLEDQLVEYYREQFFKKFQRPPKTEELSQIRQEIQRRHRHVQSEYFPSSNGADNAEK